VSDRDTTFTSLFWEELFRRQVVDLAMSSSYHPQSDGQTGVVNKSLEHYLRAFAADKPSLWVEWLPLAEYWFNTNYHTSTKLSHFEALYGYLLPRLIEFVLGWLHWRICLSIGSKLWGFWSTIWWLPKLG
jgi:hypothetical protein